MALAVAGAALAVLLGPGSSAQAVPPPSLGNPTDHFRARHAVGEQALLSLLESVSPKTMRIDRIHSGSGGAMFGSATNEDTWQASNDTVDIEHGFTQADLDVIAGTDPPRRALAPGIAIAGPGLSAAGCPVPNPASLEICVAWRRANHASTEDHPFTSMQTSQVGTPVTTAASVDGTEVALVSGVFKPGLGPTLAVAWVIQIVDGPPIVAVASVVPQRDASGKVIGLERAGAVENLGPVYEDPNHGVTSPSLAVGDFLGKGFDQLAVSWAPATSTPGAPMVSTALLETDAAGELSQATETRHHAITPTAAGPAEGQIGPDVVAVRDDNDGSPIDRIVVAPGLDFPTPGFADPSPDRLRSQLLLMTPNENQLGVEALTAVPGRADDPPSLRFPGAHSEIASVGDLDGDGFDELVSTTDPAINGFVRVDTLIIDPDEGTYDWWRDFSNTTNWTSGTTPPSGGTASAAFTDQAVPLRPVETTVLDFRKPQDQVIAPRVGSTDLRAMPQVAISFEQQATEGIPSETSYRNAVLFFTLDEDGRMHRAAAPFPPFPQQHVHPLTDWSDTEPGAAAIGPFSLDGEAELGDPIKGQYTAVEPSVILNSPPTHFDILGGEMYDPNFCYAGNQYMVPPVCFFNTEYQREVEASTEVRSQSTEAWAVSAKVTTSFSLFSVVDVDAEFRGGYGEKFSEDSGVTTTENVDVTVKSLNSDKIYAITRTYDTLEYPLYQPESAEPSGYAMAVTPHTVAKRWIDSNSPAALDIKTNHQPGNILSYPKDRTRAENPFISPTGGLDTFAHDEFELSDVSDYKYTLTQKRMVDASASTEKEWNVGATIGAGGKVAGIVDVKAEVSGDYRESNLSTTKTTAGTTTKLTASLGAIDESFGETAYVVKPFSYWTDNATLVVDYAVEPVVGEPGAPKTWWQLNYGTKPDLTLNLPRLLDLEKQAGISSDAARFTSPGVSVLQGPCTEPSVLTDSYPTPEQPLCLRAQVENYSLKDHGAPTMVEFYDADPDVGGELIGSEEVGPVAARDSRVAEVDWTPDARYAGTRPRIFAVVDAADGAAEIHEDNNKGFRGYRARASEEIALRPPAEVAAELAPGRTLEVTWDDELAATQPAGREWRVAAYPEDGGAPIETTAGGSARSASLPDLPPGRYRVAVFSTLNGASSPASHPAEPVDVALEQAELAPQVDFTEAPAPGSYTGSDARFDFDFSPADAEVECVIDGLLRPCASPLRLAGLADGPHSIQVRVSANGAKAQTPMLHWLVDGQAPTASFLGLRKLALGGKATARYRGADSGGAGIASYEIRTRTSGGRGRFADGPVLSDASDEPDRARELDVAEGETLCAAVRAVDAVGNRSRWTDERCTANPFDQSALRKKGKWKLVKGKRFSNGKALNAARKGATLSLDIGRTNVVKVLATRCGRCGKLAVRYRGKLRKVIDLSPAGGRRTRVFPFTAKWPRPRAGRLTLVSLGGGKVQVDGVAVWRVSTSGP